MIVGYEMFGWLACLKVNAPKTKLIPLCSGDSKQALLDGLLATCWREAPVVEHAKYLGVMMGPFVSLDIQWKAPVDKFFRRCIF